VHSPPHLFGERESAEAVLPTRAGETGDGPANDTEEVREFVAKRVPRRRLDVAIAKREARSLQIGE
jgi:hypothetical protein